MSINGFDGLILLLIGPTLYAMCAAPLPDGSYCMRLGMSMSQGRPRAVLCLPGCKGVHTVAVLGRKMSGAVALAWLGHPSWCSPVVHMLAAESLSARGAVLVTLLRCTRSAGVKQTNVHQVIVELCNDQSDGIAPTSGLEKDSNHPVALAVQPCR